MTNANINKEAQKNGRKDGTLTYTAEISTNFSSEIAKNHSENINDFIFFNLIFTFAEGECMNLFPAKHRKNRSEQLLLHSQKSWLPRLPMWSPLKSLISNLTGLLYMDKLTIQNFVAKRMRISRHFIVAEQPHTGKKRRQFCDRNWSSWSWRHNSLKQYILQESGPP